MRLTDAFAVITALYHRLTVAFAAQIALAKVDIRKTRLADVIGAYIRRRVVESYYKKGKGVQYE